MPSAGLLRAYLANGDGTPVLLAQANGTSYRGRWVVIDDRYFVDIEGPTPPAPGAARFRVDLPWGVHRFSAWVGPVEGNRWEVFPPERVDVEQHRAAARVTVNVPATIRTSGPSPTEADIQVCDISATGLGFASDRELPLGIACSVTLHWDAGTAMGAISGTLVRRAPVQGAFRYGMRVNGESGVREQIYAWLAAFRRTQGAGAG